MNNGFAALEISLLSRLFALTLVTGLLAGCVDTAAPAPEGTAPVRPTNMARREGISPNGASVALAAFAGAPQQLTEQFQALFGKEAKAHDINLADAKKANYVVRGYLNASPQDSGTAVAFVLDVFDGQRQRAQRIEDQIIVATAAADPWSVVDQSVLAAVAAKSADDLADFLTNTPEAIAAVERKTPGGHQPDGGETTFAASPPAPAPETPTPPARGAGFAALH